MKRSATFFGVMKMSCLCTAISLIGGCGISNFPDKCSRTGKSLSDHEIIDIALRDYLFRRGGDPLEQFSDENLKVVRAADMNYLKQFKSTSEFLSRFPSCCSLSSSGPEGKSVTFFDKISTYGTHKFVNIRYRIYIEDIIPKNNSGIPMQLIFAVNKCGDTAGIDG